MMHGQDITAILLKGGVKQHNPTI